MKFKLLKQKQLREKAQKILDGNKQILFKSVIKCMGSKIDPDCEKWIYTNGYMKKCRDMIINGLTNSPDKKDQELGIEILNQCFDCMIDHPELKPYIPRKIKMLIKLSRIKIF